MANKKGASNIPEVYEFIKASLVSEYTFQDPNARVDIDVRFQGNSNVKISGSVAARNAFVNIELETLMALKKIGYDYGKQLQVKSEINYYE